LTLAILVIARFYGRELGRNIWGIATAFGVWVSIATANNALIDFSHPLLSYWQTLWLLSFVAMVGMWTWAMWVYAPNPEIEEHPDDENGPSGPQLSDWALQWDRATSAGRKVLAP